MQIVSKARSYVGDVVENVGHVKYLACGGASLALIIAAGVSKAKNPKLSKVLAVAGTTALALTAWRVFAPSTWVKKMGTQEFYGTTGPVMTEYSGMAQGTYRPGVGTVAGVTKPAVGNIQYLGGAPSMNARGVRDFPGSTVTGFAAEDRADIAGFYPAVYTPKWTANDSYEGEKNPAYFASRYVNDLFGRTVVGFKGNDLNIRDNGATI